ncbi:MAG: 3-hydroxyacyl-CoA dehydrogenase [Nitrososphaerota archaeon]
MREQIENVAVIGAGTMGHGIAQVFLMNGFKVALLDVDDEILNRALRNIEWSLMRFVEKRRIEREEADAALSRLRLTTSYEEAVGDSDFVIEAAPEKLELKKAIFKRVDELAPPHAIIASNTSTLSISEMGESTKRPDKAIGMHWFNPPQIMNLIEVIRGAKTSDETLEKVLSLARRLGKTPIVCKKDTRGFIVNRVLVLVFNEAFWSYHRGEASIEGIDASVKYSGGFPMGWFELCDYIGIDTAYEMEKVLYQAFGERFRPCPEVIEPLVRSGSLGQKAGRGFYDWSFGRPRIRSELSGEYDVERSWVVSVNEAAWIVYEDVAEPASIDTGMKLGAGWPMGPCEYADRNGIDSIVQKLESLHKKYGQELYSPCPLLKDLVSKGFLGGKTGRGFYQY